MMASINTRIDNSFDDEVVPIQQQLQNKFNQDGSMAQVDVGMAMQ